MAHPDLFPLLPHPMENNARHNQVKDTIRKKPAKETEKNKSFKLEVLSSPKQHVFPPSLVSVSDRGEILLRLPRKIYG